MKNNAIYRALSWISYKSKRPVKSVPVVETLAVVESIDEGKMVANECSEIMDMAIRMKFCVVLRIYLRNCQ